MKKTLLPLILLLVSISLIGQNEKDKKTIQKDTNVEALKEFSERSNKNYIKYLKKFESTKSPKRIQLKNNKVAILSNFDSQGNPIYYIEDNEEAAISARVDKIWKGGTSGLELDGSGIEIGHWEVTGIPLENHREFNGRIENVENRQASKHATHTAGTMIATGVLPEARGMASNASIKAYLTDNDESEMALFGASGGILSNHSYSQRLPQINTHIYYGAYDTNASEWDFIAYNAPYLTICKSAGNDRARGFNIKDNGYDILKTVANSKNILVVGAIEDMLSYNGPSSVVQSFFSSWGPTDDWRVKPDLVTNGVSLLSSSNIAIDDYSIESGTSMSTPTVTGSIALLQQHFYSSNNVYMKSATVRALLLGTTDEAGAHDGPDFQNGWGALNAERAAHVISENGKTTKIDELTLSQGGTYTTEFNVEQGTDVTVSIAWTDHPAGDVIFGEDSQDTKLVNDLDVVLYKNNKEYRPWVLTPNATSDNFEDAATQGDNFRDNIERIDTKNLPEGKYTVKVTHKRNLAINKQDFSLVIQGISDKTLSIGDNINNKGNVSIYPNPSTDRNFNVKISNSSNGQVYKVQVYDLLGKLIKNEKYQTSDFQVQLPNVTSGIYILKIQSGNYNYQTKVYITK
ncbi:T9SS type A sorting domain-containing protein [Tenacibaculum sp. 190524A05c]|uniref:S8 family serine peptidase n=1 Tax=Tenacibaculum platacis TaxID=3137852 RepID=UPI0031FB0375